jgi:uncharacterized protein YggE
VRSAATTIAGFQSIDRVAVAQAPAPAEDVAAPSPAPAPTPVEPGRQDVTAEVVVVFILG